MNDLVSRLRSGYRPTEAEAITWNVAENIRVLRSEITEADLGWIIPPIREEEGPRASFYSALLQPFSTNAEVRNFLAHRFETASPHLKAQLLWRLLDDAALPSSTHSRLFQFVISDWDLFQNSCVSFLGGPSQILHATLGRLADCPPSKQWIYLCCLPRYASDQHAVKGLLAVSANSKEAFTAHVARMLMDLFFSEKN